MSPPTAELTIAADAANRDPKGFWRFLTVVGCFAIAASFLYLFLTAQKVSDRYTGSDAARDWGTQRELNAEVRAGLQAINQRLGRIETKLDK